MDCGLKRTSIQKTWKGSSILVMLVLIGTLSTSRLEVLGQYNHRGGLFHRDYAGGDPSRLVYIIPPVHDSDTGPNDDTVRDAYSTYPNPYKELDKNSPLLRQDYVEGAPPVKNPAIQNIDPTRRERLRMALAGQPTPKTTSAPVRPPHPRDMRLSAEGMPAATCNDNTFVEPHYPVPPIQSDLDPSVLSPDGKTRALEVREIHVPEPSSPMFHESSPEIEAPISIPPMPAEIEWSPADLELFPPLGEKREGVPGEVPQATVPGTNAARQADVIHDANVKQVVYPAYRSNAKPNINTQPLYTRNAVTPQSAPRQSASVRQPAYTPVRASQPPVSSSYPTAAASPGDRIAPNYGNVPVASVHRLPQAPPRETPRAAPPENRSVLVTAPQPSAFAETPRLYNLALSSAPWFATYIGGLHYDEHRFVTESVTRPAASYSLLESSVIASHPSNPTMANQLVRNYKDAEARLLRRISPMDSRLRRAEKVLTFMHEELMLGGYQLEQTTMENLFSNGRYNCVTATILYCCLGRAAGLEVRAVELPGHAMCWVKTERGEIDVETTCATWFQYLDDPETRRRVIGDLIRQAQEDIRTAKVRIITDRELIAKVYYNRGVDFLAEKNFHAALESNAIALLLDPTSETTKGNLLATINNWALSLCYEGQYQQSADLLRRGILEEPTYATFRKNHVHVYHCWIENLYRTGQMNEAMHVANLASSEQPTEPHFHKLQQQLQERMHMTAGTPTFVH